MPVLCRGREAPDQYSVRAFPNRWPALAEGRCEVVLYTPEHDAHFLLSAQKVPVRSLIFGLIEQRLFPHSTMLNLFSSSKIGVPKLAPRSLTHTARFTHLITYHRARTVDSQLAGDPMLKRPIDSFLNTRVGRSRRSLPRSIQLPCRSPRPPISQHSTMRRVTSGTGSRSSCRRAVTP